MSSTAPAPADQPVLLTAREDDVLTLTLNRPQRYNAISEALIDALQDALDSVAGDAGVRVVVLAGAGRAFCAGHDIGEVRGYGTRAKYAAIFERSAHLMTSIVRLRVPVIARVHGIATAAGCQLVASCDLAVASTEASFAVNGVRNGLFCSTPSVPLARNVSRKRAFEMLVTGEFIDAATAREYGLVNRVVAPERLDAEVAALAGAIVANSPVAIEMGKRMFYQQVEMGLDDAYRHASCVMADNMADPDATEGFEAFLAKRKPVWKKP